MVRKAVLISVDCKSEQVFDALICDFYAICEHYKKDSRKVEWARFYDSVLSRIDFTFSCDDCEKNEGKKAVEGAV